MIPTDRAGRFFDFCRFSKLQLASGDIDPAYPVLRRAYEMERLSTNAALWHTLLYVGWYRLSSSWRLRGLFPEMAPVRPEAIPVLPTGTERRGLRGAAGVVHAASFLNEVTKAASAHGDIESWIDHLTANRSSEDGWRSVRSVFERFPHAGPWASFKWADLLKNVHGYPIAAPDIGVGGGGEAAGPVPGMVLLTGLPWQECAGTPAHQRWLLYEARAKGVPFGGLDQLETCLCNFASLCKGRYYSGADIDEQQHEFVHAGVSATWWEARAAFPDAYRGELGDWVGVRAHLRTLYRDKGVIYVPPGFSEAA